MDALKPLSHWKTFTKKVLASSFVWIGFAFPLQQPVYTEYLKLQLGSTVDTENVYRVHSEINCGGLESPGLPGFMGTLKILNEQGGVAQNVRFDLFQGKKQTLVSLGPLADKYRGFRAQVSLEPHLMTKCKVYAFQTAVESFDLSDTPSSADEQEKWYRRALRHSPYLVVRPDQRINRQTDLPLELIYSVISDDHEQTDTLIYTIFFSDQDAKKTTEAVEAQFGRYGRGTDVEWIYRVTFRRDNNEVIRSEYQGALLNKWREGFSPRKLEGDHAAFKFKGEYFPGSQHPILYDVAENNVFSDTPHWKEQKSDIMYRLGILPEHRVVYPSAREIFQFSPLGLYMHLVSYIETRNAGKGHAKPSDYLFVRMRGSLQPNNTSLQLNNGAFTIVVGLQEMGNLFKRRFESASSVDRLGEDLFHQESIPAVFIGEDKLKALSNGQATLNVHFKDVRRIGKTQEFAIDGDEFELFRLVWNSELLRFEKESLNHACQAVDFNLLDHSTRLDAIYSWF